MAAPAAGGAGPAATTVRAVSHPLEDYALIGDTETVALVCKSGSIDWLCLPRFDAGACFAELLGDDSHGRWLIAPVAEPRAIRRRYRPGTLVLETEFDSDGGTVRVIDCMPPRGSERALGTNPDVVRVVEGVRGRVQMRMQLVIRFDYGWVVPWVTHDGGRLRAVAGPDGLLLTTPVTTRGENLTTVADFTVAAGDRIPFVLTWFAPHQAPPPAIDGLQAVQATTEWWQRWSGRSTYDGEWSEAVERSLITLKALTYAPTGGLVAAPTTSLPERIGGVRNWDYRYVWLRDATYTLYSLMLAGYRDEAGAFRDWLLRVVAGDPTRIQIMYSVDGVRRLPELELPWLPGYEDSRPVRIGNAACNQLQIDVYGEAMDALHYARRIGIQPEPTAWALQCKLMEHLETCWDQPDHGIWEVRGGPRDFTHSRVMAWVAFDRAVKAIEQYGRDGPLDRWRRIRDDIHAEVLERGFDAERNTFTQIYGQPHLDASLLLIPQVGFLPASDPRVRGTVDAIERELVDGPFVQRYQTDVAPDGLPPGEGSFLLCAFWLVDTLAMIGRQDEARSRYEQLLALRNDVGLLAEECDAETARLVGNFPQAFSHIGVINVAVSLAQVGQEGTVRPEHAEAASAAGMGGRTPRRSNARRSD